MDNDFDYDDDDDDDDDDDSVDKSVSVKLKDGGVDYESIVHDEDQLLHPHPNFWLFIQITEEYVNVYFHHRYAISSQIYKQVIR